MVRGAPDYEGIAKQVMRADLYEAAMKEIGYQHAGLNNEKETFFDGATFDPGGDLEAYAKSFAVHNLQG
jgi:nitrate/nitrite transport system substrate-binding protein